MKPLAPRAEHTTAGPVSGISRRVCTRHTTSDANPSLPARFPSWWHEEFPLPSEASSRVYTRDGILDMEDACGPAKVRKSAPRVHTGRGSRHGLVKVERFPCWPEVSLSPQSEIPSRVYTRDGISGTYTDGQLAAKANAQGRGPPARSYGHLPAKEDWSPSRRQQAPTPRGETTPIVRPPVFPERFSLHARQPGRNFNGRVSRGTLDDPGEEKGRPRDGVTLGPRPPLVDPLSTIGLSINARTMPTTRPHDHFCDGPSVL